MQYMTEFQKQYEESQQEENIDMLSKSQQRHQNIDKSLNRIGRLTFNKVFTDYRRDIELCSIAKTVQALSSSKKSPMKASELSSVNTSTDGGSQSSAAPHVAFGTRAGSLAGGSSRNYRQATNNTDRLPTEGS